MTCAISTKQKTCKSNTCEPNSSTSKQDSTERSMCAMHKWHCCCCSRFWLHRQSQQNESPHWNSWIHLHLHGLTQQLEPINTSYIRHHKIEERERRLQERKNKPTQQRRPHIWLHGYELYCVKTPLSNNDLLTPNTKDFWLFRFISFYVLRTL